MPNFWIKEPELYFANIEATFFTHKVEDDLTKFQLVISSLGPEELKLIRPLLDPESPNRTYENLKKTLILEFSQSKQEKTRALLSQLKLDNQQPTTLLRKMRELADGAISDEFLKSMFLNQLPHYAQSILAISKEPLDALAKQADQILSFSTPYETQAVSRGHDSVIAALASKIEELTLKVDRLTRNSERQHYRGRSRKRSATPRHSSDSDKCFYHEKFGEKARYCRSPCVYKSRNQKND